MDAVPPKPGVTPDEADRPWEEPVSEEDIAAYAERKKAKALEEKYTTPGHFLAAGVEGLARGLTGGISTVLQTEALRKMGELGDPEAAQAIRDIHARGETGAATAGEVASYLLPMAAGTKLGAKVLGKAGSAALKLSAPSLITEVGQLTGRAVEGALPEASGLMAKALRRAVTQAAQGTTEGALAGLSHVVHESAFENPDYNGEAMLADVGWGAGMGFGMGTGLGLAEVALPAAVSKAKSVASNVFKRSEEALGAAYKAGEAVTGTTGDVAQVMLELRPRIEELSKTLPGLPEAMAKARTPEMAAWMLDNTDKLARGEAFQRGFMEQLTQLEPQTANLLIENLPNVITDPLKRFQLEKQIASGLGDMTDAVEAASKRLNSKLAPDEAERLIRQHYPEGADTAPVQKATADLTARVDEALEKIRAKPELYVQGTETRLRGIRDGFVRDLEGADPVEAFGRMRRLRQSIKDIVPKGSEGASQAGKDSKTLLWGLYHDTKAVLTDEATFGANAARQATLDALTTDYIRSQGRFQKVFMEKVPGKGFGEHYALAPTKINAWLNSMASLRSEAKSAVLGEYVDAAKALADHMDTYSTHLPSANADAKGLKSLLERTMENVEPLRKDAAATHIMKSLQGHDIISSGPYVRPSEAHAVAESVGMALLPHVISGAIHSVGKVLKVAKSVPTGLAALSLIERAGQNVAKAVDIGVKGLLATGPTARRVATVAFRPTSKEETKARLERVRELSGNLDAAQDVLEHQGKGLDEAPRVTQAAQLASVRGLAYLASKAPPVARAGPLGKPLEPNADESFRFNRAYNIVDRPQTLLEHARRGTLTPLDVEAAAAVYPQLLSRIQEQLLSHLMDHGGPVPYRTRLMTAMLLGHDVDGTLTPMAIQAAQAVYQQAPPAQPGNVPRGNVRPSQAGLSKLSLGSRMRTGMQASTERREGG